jgi:nucleotide-binding universal stress UspA family protein
LEEFKVLPDIKTILYCTSLGPNTSYVFRYAWSIAKKFDAKIVVLHVLESLKPVQIALVEGYSGEGSLSKTIQKATREAKQRIPKRIEEFCRHEAGNSEWRNVISKIVVLEGRVGPLILEQVRANAADIVIMGASAEGTLMENLIGGATRVVVKKSPVPVLTVQVPEGRQELTLDI